MQMSHRRFDANAYALCERPLNWAHAARIMITDSHYKYVNISEALCVYFQDLITLEILI